MSRLALLASLLLAVSGCSAPRVVPVIGPDGSSMLHVSCGDREGECYRLAGEHCPYGYDVWRTIAGAGNMLVRCRAPRATPQYPAYAAYTASPASAPAVPAYEARSAVAPGTPAPVASASPAPSASAAATSPAPGAATSSNPPDKSPPDSAPFDVGY